MLILTYLAVWAIALIMFWFFTSGSDAMGYSLMFLWVLLPVTTFVTAALIGKNDYWGKYNWFSVIVFGVMYMLAEYATFSTANMVAFEKVNAPEFMMILYGALIALAGLGVGKLMNRKKTKAK